MKNRQAARTIAIIFCAASLSPLAAGAETFHKQPLAKDHPALGAWRVEVPDLKCFEQMEIRADGTRSLISGKEVAQAELSISAKPNAHGLYKWIDKTVEDNGKPDCSGQVTPVGEVSTNYIGFSADKNSFLLCRDAQGKKCLAQPFRRLSGDPV